MSEKDIEVCEGLSIGKSFFEKKENRILTLFLKGFTVYLLTMGSIGFYMSAFGIRYNQLLAHTVIFVMAMLCAMLYYRLLVENLGYLVLFISFAYLVYVFRTYINSGFYAVVNITVQNASTYLDVDVQRLYTEQIENRYVTVTLFVLFVGIVLDVFLNVYISRRMQYVTVFCVIMTLNLIPLYLVMEPDVFYVIMILGGIAMAYVFKVGRHYSPQVKVKRDNNKFKQKLQGMGKHKRAQLDYVYDVRSMLQAGIWTFLIALLVIVNVRAFKPVDNFNVGHEENPYKQLTMSGISTFMLEGFQGFNRNRDDNGGLNSGKLGNVASIKIDGQTDIILQFTPYCYDRIYLKTFVGGRYNPYENTWTSVEDIRNYEENTPEANAYRNYYEQNGDKSSRGVMRQLAVDTNGVRFAAPYYMSDVEFDDSRYANITYYPYIEGNAVYVNEDEYAGEPLLATDLEIPSENIDTINSFIDELGMIGDDNHNIEMVKDYFTENIPYTIKPGKTPKKEDFVNYFLEDNRKGYCAHFASAAVLAFRAMGIPARYVEGYAVDYNQITMNGELVEGESYSDYYDGYSELGETALVEVKVTDADAHAWVEVYERGKGWRVVEVTPASDEEEDTDDFWDMFDKVVGPQDADGLAAGGALPDINLSISDATLRKIITSVGIAIAAVILVVICIRCGHIFVKRAKYVKANNSDKLIMKYGEFSKRIARRNRAYKACRNYHEQLAFIHRGYESCGATFAYDINLEELERILDKAGFAGKEISESELEKALRWIASVNVKSASKNPKITTEEGDIVE